MRYWTRVGVVVALGCIGSACDPDERASVPTTAAPETEPAPQQPVVTLPAVDRFDHPTGALDVVAQVSVRAPFGPDVALLTVYGNGGVIAATPAGWRIGAISELEIQGLLDDADAVGLLDDSLVLRGPDTDPESAAEPTPDLTIRFDVDGRRLVHELDLSRIERPPSIRSFVNDTAVQNRFGLETPFEPDEWIACSSESGCAVVGAQQDPTTRPVLPHEDSAALLDR